ncbi:MAG TPA: ATP synthase F0 subunit B [Blastocatellia bacterium]|nr:ATP synthase F0 subunit B [Blastocatellia bacterium]
MTDAELFAPPILLALVNLALAKAINLAIFFAVLYYLLRRPTREFFRTRFAEIRASLQRAAGEKEAAAAKLAEINTRLDRLDAELAAMRAEAEREAAASRSRIEAEARQEAEKLRALAAREVDAAKQIAIIDLRRFAAEQSVALAEQIIRRELTPEDDARLLRRAGEEMGQAK